MLDWHLTASASHIGCTLTTGGAPLSFRDVLDGWRLGGAFTDRWAELLADVPLEAYAWEVPPLSTEGVDRPFECVFVSSPPLASASPEPGPFAERFRAARERRASVATFESLGRDALLVAPCPEGQPESYTHIAVFHRRGSRAQVTALWAAVATGLEARLGHVPAWLSTAGLGVHWLHVRIDSRPKYYRHRPYADPAYGR
jgi:hypothetical protein